MSMKIVIAPQSFKGSISGLQAARAIARGVRIAEHDSETVLIPVADGGDGTLNALVDSTGGQTFCSKVTGPLGKPVDALWGVMGDGQTAVIEMARPSGLALVPASLRNPRITTTRGTGEIIKEALDYGFRRIIIGLGGSASNDGGAGMASALGIKFLDSHGQNLSDGGAALARLAKIDITNQHPRLTEAEIIGATDVTNPLCGPIGASTVYGPQKGAKPVVVTELEFALLNFAEVVQRDLDRDILNRPRAGAAGGLGAGLIAFAGAKLRSGIDLICEAVDFDNQLEGADLVITGEGRADGSTIYDKAPVGVARHALRRGAPTILIAGSIGPGYEKLYEHGISGITCITDQPMKLEESLARTSELLEGAAERVIRFLRVGIGMRDVL
jgi:glycerate kinase